MFLEVVFNFMLQQCHAGVWSGFGIQNALEKQHVLNPNSSIMAACSVIFKL